MSIFFVNIFHCLLYLFANVQSLHNQAQNLGGREDLSKYICQGGTSIFKRKGGNKQGATIPQMSNVDETVYHSQQSTWQGHQHSGAGSWAPESCGQPMGPDGGPQPREQQSLSEQQFPSTRKEATWVIWTSLVARVSN